ncbi:MAG TPA: PEP-CTERM system TPR-repeat protein PrsT [Thiobacillaceae bacterium]|nr:PEP-CTERM system TPR-repeat protein PrsT [Thiobacillaceae bacterium]
MQLRPLATAMLIASLFAVTLPGCGKLLDPSVEELVARARVSQQKGDLKASIIDLKNAAQKDPSNPEVRRLLADSYIQSGLGAEAEKELIRAKEFGAAPGPLMLPLARSLLLQNAYQRLVDEIRPAPDIVPADKARLLHLLGEAQLGLGNLERGCAEFDDSAQADPQYAHAYIGQAKCAFARKDAEQARSLILHARRLDPQDVQSWLLEAELEDQLGNAKAAHAAYGQALQIAPNDMAAITGHAYTALKLGDVVAARKDIDRARKRYPESIPIKYLEGLAAFSEGKPEITRDKAQDILRRAPDHTSALLLLGLSSYRLGEYETARSNLSRVLAKQPENTAVRKLLAELMIRAGEGRQALDLMRPALNQPSPDTQSLALAASASAISGQLADARRLFVEALEKDPDQATLQVALARTQAASGEQERALETLRAAARNDTPDFQANKLLVQTLLQLHRHEEALAVAQALRAKHPDRALPLNLEGAIRLAREDLAGARQSFSQAIEAEPSDEAAVLNLAQVDIAENKLADAQTRLQKLASGQAQSVEALLLLASIERRQGNDTAYVNTLQSALTAAPQSVPARVQLMRHYLDKNAVRTALTYTRDGDRYGMKNATYLDLKGRIQIAAGEASGAVATYQKLLQLAPRSVDAHVGMAAAQAAAGNPATARSTLATALKLDPDHPEALARITMLEAAAGDLAAAREHASMLQARHPASPTGFALEGDLLLGQGKPAEAAKRYERAFAIAPSGATALSLFKARYRAGEKARAYEAMDRWLKDHPDDHLSRAYLASAHKADGRPREAARHLEYILSKTPENIAIQNDLALVYVALRDPRALGLAEKAYARQPDSASIADTYGWALLAGGRTEDSVRILRKAADLAPADPSIRYRLAQALAKAGKRADARAELKTALDAKRPFPESADARRLLGELER